MSDVKAVRSAITRMLDDYVDVKGAGAAAPAAVGGTLSSSVKALLKRPKGVGSARVTGLKPIRLRMPYSFAMSCAAGGLIAQSQSVLADSNTTEWAALAALYDEYKVHGGEVSWANTYQTPAGANTIDAMGCVLAFDPIDSVVLTGVRNGSEMTQHQLKMAQATAPSATTSAAVSMSFGRANGEPYRFRFTTVPGFSANSTTVLTAPGAWKQIVAAGSNSPDGWLKYYGTSDNANPVTCVTGIVYLDVSFRARK